MPRSFEYHGHQRMMVFIDGNYIMERLRKIPENREIDFVKDKFNSWPKRIYFPSMIELCFHPLLLESDISFMRPISYIFLSQNIPHPNTHDDFVSVLASMHLRVKVFPCKKQNGGYREKGVDVGLATEMLMNSFQKNTDLISLVAADADYVPAIEAVLRNGQRIFLNTWGEAELSDLMKSRVDYYRNLKGLEENFLIPKNRGREAKGETHDD